MIDYATYSSPGPFTVPVCMYAPADNTGIIAATGILSTSCHTGYRKIPSVPSASTGTISGNRHYLTNPIRGTDYYYYYYCTADLMHRCIPAIHSAARTSTRTQQEHSKSTTRRVLAVKTACAAHHYCCCTRQKRTPPPEKPPATESRGNA